eukprot:SAG11_NODE_2002_length_3938_cov_2.562126_1_plen_66_part_10
MALSEFQVKLADMGTACWVTKHFTDDIQTRVSNSGSASSIGGGGGGGGGGNLWGKGREHNEQASPP